jgi:hypothetical protein
MWNPKKPDFVIHHNGVVYLKRWWLIPRNKFFNIYLHKFEHDDDDRALHDHPWRSLSLPIRGGYWDVLPRGVMVKRKAWRFIYRNATQAHRVVLTKDKNGATVRAWTIFITGPVVRDWGFLCPQGWRHWRDFTAPNDKGSVGRGCE